ncbi:XkdX family protein [Lacrimispora sp.]|nr:XkdX family protein [Lacrimispora sp.]
MFDTLLRLFDGGNGPLTVAMLANAVVKNWITKEQKQEILAS